MEAIDNPSGYITVPVVAHHLSALRNGSMVVELMDGKVSQVGSYQEVVRHLKQ
jgi:ABC-type bacteriocin/lantibiotic exporter with double-glycine peptidase domain